MFMPGTVYVRRIEYGNLDNLAGIPVRLSAEKICTYRWYLPGRDPVRYQRTDTIPLVLL